MSNNFNDIPVVNMRTFFNREIFMHSIGDVRFKQPIALKKVMYMTMFLLVYSLPIIYFVGLQFNPWFLLITFLPPLVLGHFANKPVWGGRTLVEFARVTGNYLSEPKGWTDHRNNNNLGKDSYTMDHNIWVSRRRELQLLAGLKEEITTGQRTNHRVLYEDDNGNIIDVIDTLPPSTIENIKKNSKPIKGKKKENSTPGNNKMKKSSRKSKRQDKKSGKRHI